MNNILGHKTNLKKYRTAEVSSLKYNAIKLKINSKRIPVVA